LVPFPRGSWCAETFGRKETPRQRSHANVTKLAGLALQAGGQRFELAVELFAEPTQSVACLVAGYFGVDLHCDRDLVVTEDPHGDAEGVGAAVYRYSRYTC
jgi:hypothetical protein